MKYISQNRLSNQIMLSNARIIELIFYFKNTFKIKKKKFK